MTRKDRILLPRWVAPVLLLTACALGPWTLYLTYSLPSRHLTRHYDLAWVGYDVALLAAFALTGWFAFRSSQWLVPAAAMTGTMLLADAWFDIVTSSGGGEQIDAIIEACLAELPLAALCAYIVYDVERFSATLRARRRRQ